MLRSRLIIVALGLWLFSFVLPAHAEFGFGFHCFTLSLLFGVYPRLSVATNLLPLVTLVSVFADWKAFRSETAFSWRWSTFSGRVAKLSVAACLLNLCWLVYSVNIGYTSSDYMTLAGELRIGYYLWVLSFMLLALGGFLESRASFTKSRIREIT